MIRIEVKRNKSVPENKENNIELGFKHNYLILFLAFGFILICFHVSILYGEVGDIEYNGNESTRLVTLDSEGVLRWDDNGEEVAFFGVNYCLPSASGYRMVKNVGASLEKTIERDLYHLSRMGLNGLRLSFWGDWESSDIKGNLIDNEHLKMLDYLVYKAKQRGFYMLFSPIVAYNSNWPDLSKEPDESAKGFSSKYPKRTLGIDPNAIKAQFNYLSQIINHVNRYTGVADYLKRWSIEMLIKDEKQHLGLGDYRVKRYRAVVRHLHLVDCAYACLTHVGIKAYRAQGQNKSKNVLQLETISKLKDRMRRIVWQENVQDVIKYSHEKPVIRRLEKLLAA